jgi:rhodanese-related sulfurtransferase
MNTISIDNVMNLDNPIIVDIRDNYSYNISHIKNAINIPYYNLLNNFSHYLSKDKVYYLYCSEGKQSYEISKRLNSFGYNTMSIAGGFISF